LDIVVKLKDVAVPSEGSGLSNTAMTNSNGKFRFSLATWIGWGFVGLAAVTMVWGISNVVRLHYLAGQASPISLLAEVLFQLVLLAFAVPAALIITRQPTNRIGWLMALPVLGSILENITRPHLQTVTTPTPSLFLLLVLWLENIAWILFVFPILLILLLFPTGRPPSPRWNWVSVYASVMLAFICAVNCVATTIITHR
jgi:hypothetical protein